jgi:hypothetical protein
MERSKSLLNKLNACVSQQSSGRIPSYILKFVFLFFMAALGLELKTLMFAAQETYRLSHFPSCCFLSFKGTFNLLHPLKLPEAHRQATTHASGQEARCVAMAALR